MRKCLLVAIVVVAVAGASTAPVAASDIFGRSPLKSCESEPTRANPWMVNWAPAPAANPALLTVPTMPRVYFGLSGTVEQTPPGRPRPLAFEYSEGYKIRAKIHKVASIATLPLFVAEYLVGRNLYNNFGTASGSARSAHGVLAASTGVLFGVNTITGVWNLIEARKDPNRSTKRTIHAVLMLVADAGFAATGATAPESEHGRFEREEGGGSRSTHRAIALTSMGIATISYLMMLLGGN